MTTIASTAPRRGVRPRQPGPSLELPLLGGGVFRLAERRPERIGSSSDCPSPKGSRNHRRQSGACSSRGDGATRNRRCSTSRGSSSSIQTERTTTSRSCRCQPVGRDSTTCSVASTTGRRSAIPLAATPDVCDTRARSTQKGRVLHRDSSAIRLSGEHDRHQAGRPKWRNQPIERQRRRTARRLVRPVRAGSAGRRPSQVPSRGALTPRRSVPRPRSGSQSFRAGA